MSCLRKRADEESASHLEEQPVHQDGVRGHSSASVNEHIVVHDWIFPSAEIEIGSAPMARVRKAGRSRSRCRSDRACWWRRSQF